MEIDNCTLAPFYEYISTVVNRTSLDLSSKECNTKHIDFKGSHNSEFLLNSEINLLLLESKKKNSISFDVRLVMRFCKVENFMDSDGQTSTSMVDQFPQHLKIKVNNKSIFLSKFLPYDKDRRDGRRNHRIIDVTDAIHENKNSSNKIVIQWTQDDCQEKFIYSLYLVRRRSLHELSYSLTQFQTCPIKRTTALFQEQMYYPSSNKEIECMVQTRTVMNISLICPISLSRISTPARGILCTHLQCFDLVTYILINFIKPTWVCPICDQTAFFSYLEIDGLILSILKDKRSQLISEIKFNIEGLWKPTDVDDENLDKEIYFEIPKSYYLCRVYQYESKKEFDTQKNQEKHSRKQINSDLLRILTPTNWIERFKSKINSSNPQIMNPQSISKTDIIQSNPQTVIDSLTNICNIPATKRNSENFETDFNCNKDIPVKKSKLDIRSIPKSNGTKINNGKVVDGEFKNSDSKNMSHTISEYHFNNAQNQIQTIQKEKFVYGYIESAITAEILKFHNYWFYAHCTGIPNNFKFPNAPKRQMAITILNNTNITKLTDLFLEFNRSQATSHIWLHAVNKSYIICIDGVSSPILLQKNSTLEIKKSDGKEKNITIQCNGRNTIVVLEILEPIVIPWLNLVKEPTWTYNVNEDDYRLLKSFVRKTLTPDQENNFTRIVAAYYATTRGNLRSTIVSISILNYEGDLILNTIVTPRESIKHYQSHAHGMFEKDIIGNYDGEDCAYQIRKICDGKIIIGIQVMDLLEAVNFPMQRALGIRDLGSAKYFEDMEFRKYNGSYKIGYLSKMILNETVSNKNLQTENYVHIIRAIYLKIRNSWVDHIMPGNGRSTLFSIASKRKSDGNNSQNIPKQCKTKEVMAIEEYIPATKAFSRVGENEYECTEEYSNTSIVNSEELLITEVVPADPILFEAIKIKIETEVVEKLNVGSLVTKPHSINLDGEDPIFLEYSSKHWKPRITHYRGSEINCMAISNPKPPILDVYGQPHILSSLVYKNAMTNDTLLLSYKPEALALRTKFACEELTNHSQNH